MFSSLPYGRLLPSEELKETRLKEAGFTQSQVLCEVDKHNKIVIHTYSVYIHILCVSMYINTYVQCIYMGHANLALLPIQ